MDNQYYIERDVNGNVSVKTCKVGEPFEVLPILFGFGFGEPNECALELATAILCDHLGEELKPFEYMVGGFKGQGLTGPFMWGFLMGDGPVIEITEDQITNYLEVQDVRG